MKLLLQVGSSSRVELEIGVNAEQVTSRFSDAFIKLLDTYELIGDSLPLLEKCQESFLENTPYVQQAMVAIYRDILEFHESALRYFRKSGESPSRLSMELY